jgi:enoyl-CoA hydratase/carnithine racemase
MATEITTRTTVRYDRIGDVAVVTLDAPPLNLFDETLFADFDAALDRTDQDLTATDPVRTLVLRADGDRFSGGVDVHVFQDRSTASGRELISRGFRTLHRLEGLPIPTITAAHGFCFAAGIEVALATDLVFAAAGTVFSQVEARIGAATFLGGAQRIAQRAGRSRAAEIVYSGNFYTAEQFENWGIINRVYPGDQLQDKTLAFAHKLAAGPTRAHQVTKRILSTFDDSGIRAADDMIIDIATPLFETHDMQHGVTTLLEHGAASVTGRTTFVGR